MKIWFWTAVLWLDGRIQTLPQVRLPGDARGGDLLGVMSSLILYGGRLSVLVLGFASAVVVGWQLIKAFQAARASNDWGQFSAVVLTGALVMLMVVGAGQLAWSYLESIEGIG